MEINALTDIINESLPIKANKLPTGIPSTNTSPSSPKPVTKVADIN